MKCRFCLVMMIWFMIYIPAQSQSPTWRGVLYPVPGNELIGLGLFNPNDHALAVRARLIDTDGHLVTEGVSRNPVELNLAAGEQYPRYIHDLFGITELSTATYVRLEADDPVHAFFMAHDSQLSLMDGLNLGTRSGKRFHFMRTESPFDGDTHIALVNDSVLRNTVRLRIRDGADVSENRSVDLAPEGCTLLALDDLFPRADEGIVDLQSDEPVFAAVYGAGDGYLWAGKANTPSRAGLELLFPHYACGDGYQSLLYLMNPGQQSVRLTLQVYPDDADASPVREHSITVGVGRCLAIDLHEDLDCRSEPMSSGYLRLISTSHIGDLQGVLVIRHAGGAVTAMPAFQVPVSQAFFSHVASGDGWLTGITLVNPGPRDATVNLTLHDQEGQTVARIERHLLAGTRQAHLVREFFPVVGQMGGYIEMNSDQPVYAFEVFGRSDGNLYSAVPPLPDPDAPGIVGGDCSDGPRIAFFTPSAGEPGDEIRIYGRGFGSERIEDNRVFIGSTPLEVVSASGHMLTALVSDQAERGALAVEVGECRDNGDVFEIVRDPLEIRITSPVNGSVVDESAVVIQGIVSGGVDTVRVNGVTATISEGRFAVEIQLHPGENSITAQAESNDGRWARDRIILNWHPAPEIRILSPVNGAEIDDGTVRVTGSVSDWVRDVTINGLQATVDQGYFELNELPLEVGSNDIVAVARADWGGPVRHRISVTRVEGLSIVIETPRTDEWLDGNPVWVVGTCSEAVEQVTVNGNPATVAAGRFEAEISLPEGTHKWIRAVAFRGVNMVSAETWVNVDRNPPQIFISAPEIVHRDEVWSVQLDVADEVAVTALHLDVDGLVTPPELPFQPATGGNGFSRRWKIPAGRVTAGADRVQWHVRAEDRAGHLTEVSATVAVQETANDRAWVLGEVFDGQLGVPLDHVAVAVLGEKHRTECDSEGWYRVSLSPGPAMLRIWQVGFTPVFRSVDALTDRGTVAIDARLMPRGEPVTVSPGDGGEIRSEDGSITLTIPPDALVESTGVQLTPVPAQSLGQVLPAGWSPWGCADIAPWSLSVDQPAELVGQWPHPPGDRLWMVCRLDPDTGYWQRVSPENCSMDERGVAFHVRRGGQYVLAVADPGDMLPADPPAEGLRLAIADAGTISPMTEIRGGIHPQAVATGSGMLAMAEIEAVTTAPALSGAMISASFTHRYETENGHLRQGRRYIQDIVLYRPPGNDPLHLSAKYPVFPLADENPVDLREGVVAIDVFPGRNDTRGMVVEEDGYVLQDEFGNQLAIEGGGMAEGIWVDFRLLDPDDLVPTGNDGLTPLAGFLLDLAGSDDPSLNVDVELNFPVADESLAFYRLLRFGDEYLYEYACPARKEGARVVSLRTMPDGVPAPGMTGSGRYVLCREEGRLVYAFGSVTQDEGEASAVLVRSLDYPVVATVRSDGGYFLQGQAAPDGALHLHAQETIHGLEAAQDVEGPWGGNECRRVDLELRPMVPEVIATWPADGAVGMDPGGEIEVEFDGPLDPASIDSGDISVDGQAIGAGSSILLREGNRRLVVVPVPMLQSGLEHRLVVGPDVRNMYGRPMVDAFTLSFTTSGDGDDSLSTPSSLTVQADTDSGSITLTADTCPIPDGGYLEVINMTTGEVVTRTHCRGSGLDLTLSGTPWDDLRISVVDATGHRHDLTPEGIRDQEGYAYVGRDGGRVEGTGGVTLDIPPGALPRTVKLRLGFEGVTSSHPPLDLEESAEVVFAGRVIIESDYAGRATRELNLSFPAPEGAIPGRANCVLTRLVSVEGPQGDRITRYGLLGTASVGTDGLISNDCPPFSGVMTCNGEINAFYQTGGRQMVVITGDVMDVKGQPVSGAVVYGARNMGTASLVSRSGETGQFSLLTYAGTGERIHVGAWQPETGAAGQTEAIEVRSPLPAWAADYSSARLCRAMVYLKPTEGQPGDTPLRIRELEPRVGRLVAGEFKADDVRSRAFARTHVLEANPDEEWYVRFRVETSRGFVEADPRLGDNPWDWTPLPEPEAGLETRPESIRQVGAYLFHCRVRDENGQEDSISFSFAGRLVETDQPEPVPGAPHLLRTVPADGSGMVLCGTSIRLDFSEPVSLRAMLGPGTESEAVELQAVDGGESVRVDCYPEEAYDEDYHRTLVITPIEELLPDREYRLRIIPGGQLYDVDDGEDVVFPPESMSDGAYVLTFRTFTPGQVGDDGEGTSRTEMARRAGDFVFLLANESTGGAWGGRLEIWDYRDVRHPRRCLQQVLPLIPLAVDARQLPSGMYVISVLCHPGATGYCPVVLVYSAFRQGIEAGRIEPWPLDPEEVPRDLALHAAATLGAPGSGVPVRVCQAEMHVFAAIAGLGVKALPLEELRKGTQVALRARQDPVVQAMDPRRGLNDTVGTLYPTGGQCLDVVDMNRGSLPEGLVAVADGSVDGHGRVVIIDALGKSKLQPGGTDPSRPHVKAEVSIPAARATRRVLMANPLRYLDREGHPRHSPLLVCTGPAIEGGTQVNIYRVDVENERLRLTEECAVRYDGQLVPAINDDCLVLIGQEQYFPLMLGNFHLPADQLPGEPVEVEGLSGHWAVLDGNMLYLARGREGVATFSLGASLNILGIRVGEAEDKPVYLPAVPVRTLYETDSVRPIRQQIVGGIPFYYQVAPAALAGEDERVRFGVLCGENGLKFDWSRDTDVAMTDSPRWVDTVEQDICATLESGGCENLSGMVPSVIMGQVVMGSPDGYTGSGQGERDLLSAPTRVRALPLLQLHAAVLRTGIEAVPLDLFAAQPAGDLPTPQPTVIELTAGAALNLRTFHLWRQEGDQCVRIMDADLDRRLARDQTGAVILNAPVDGRADTTAPCVLLDVNLEPGTYLFEIEAEALYVTGSQGQRWRDAVRGTLQVVLRDRQVRAVGKSFHQGVDLVAGTFVRTATDLQLADKGLDLGLSRTWSSGNDRWVGPFGHGWDHSAAVRIVRDHSGDYIVCGGDGAGLRFRREGGALVPQRGHHSRLEEAADGTLVLHTKTNRVYRFRNPYPAWDPRRLAGEMPLVAVEDPDGNRIEYEYDLPPLVPSPQLRRLRHSSGSVLEFDYEKYASPVAAERIVRARLISSGGEVGETAAYTYDGCNRLVEVDVTGRDGDGHRLVRYEYGSTDDTRFRLAGIRGPNDGNRLAIEYESAFPDDPYHSAHRRVRALVAGGTVRTRFERETGSGDRSRETAITDGEGRRSVYGFDDFGALWRITQDVALTDPDGNRRVETVETRMEWRTAGREFLLVRQIEPDGRIEEFDYDERGNRILRRVIPAGGGAAAEWHWYYDREFNRPLLQLSPLGTLTRWILDGCGREVERIDDAPADGVAAKLGSAGAAFRRALARRAKAAAAPLALRTRTVYDAAGNRLAEINPRGDTVRYAEYDSHGRAAVTVDAAGRVTRRTWNAWGEKLQETGPLGDETVRVYDGFHRVVSETRTNGISGEAAAERRVITTFYPGGQVRTRMTEDLRRPGHFLRETRELDGLDRLVVRREEFAPAPESFDTRREMMDYDGAGNVLLRREEYRAGSGPWQPFRTHAYTYNDLNKEIEHQVDGHIVARTGTDTSGRRVWTRDALGRLRRFSQDGFGREAWEVAGPVDPHDSAPAGLACGPEFVPAPAAAAGHYARTRAYDMEGRVVAERDFCGAVTRRDLDALGRVVAETDPLGIVTEYEWDGAGNRVRETNLARGLETRIGYDGVGRPVERIVTSLRPAEPFTYRRTRGWTDGAGSVSREIDAATGTVTERRTDAWDREWCRVVDADGLALATVTVRDAFGHTVLERDPGDGEVRTEVTPQGWLLARTDPEGFVTRHEIGPDGRPRVTRRDIAPGERLETAMEIDYADRVVRERLNRDGSTDPAGWSVEMSRTWPEFVGRGEVTAVSWTETDVLGRTVTHVEDAMGREVRRLHPLNDAAPSLGREEVFGYDGCGRTIWEMGRDGWVDRRTYDAAGRLTRFDEAVENARTGEKAAGFKAVAIRYRDGLGERIEVDRRGHETLFHRDPLGRETEVRRLGVTPATDNPGGGLPTADGSLVLKRVAYDSENRPLWEADAAGQATVMTYDGAGRVIERRSGLLLAEKAASPVETPDSWTTWRTYDATGHVLSEATSRLGREYPVAVSTWNRRGECLGTADARGETADGGPVAVRVTEFAYDGLGRRVARTDPSGRRTAWRYDRLDRLVEVREAAGTADEAVTRYGYDARGPVRVQQDAEGRMTEWRYDNWERMISRHLYLEAADPGAPPAGEDRVWRYRWDATGHPLGEIDPLGRERIRTWDRLGRQTSEAVTWAVEQGDVAYPDVLERVDTHYDANGNPLRTAATLRSRADWLPPAARPADTGDPLPDGWRRGVVLTRCVYDDFDRLAAVTDGHWGVTTRFAYNANGARTGITFHEEAGGGSPSVRYRWDSANRLQSVERNTPGGGAKAVREPGSRPDPDHHDAGRGRTLPGGPMMKYGDPNRSGLSEQTASDDHWIPGGSDHFPAADPVLPAPGPGAKAAAAGIRAAEPLAVTTWQPGELPDTLTRGDGSVTTWSHYANGWVRSLETHTADGELVSRFEYDYDADGNRIAQREWNATPQRRTDDPLWGAAPAETRYGYDARGRLVRVEYPDGRTVRYTLDRVGNRLTETETGPDGPVRDRVFTVNGLNQVTAIRDRLVPERSLRFEYDAAGEMTARVAGELDASGRTVAERRRIEYAWDGWGRLRRVTRTEAGAEPRVMAEFTYDAEGRRVRHDSRFVTFGGLDVPAESRWTLYDGQSPLAEYGPTPDGVQPVLQHRYLYGTALLAREGAAESSPPAGKAIPRPEQSDPRGLAADTRFYVRDTLGSTVNVLRDGQVSGAYLYDAWGNFRELAAAGTVDADPGLDDDGRYAWERWLEDVQGAFAEDDNRLTFTGYEFDPATGLYYARARFYDPQLGRFASPDTVPGDRLSPPSLHRYLYAWGSPLRYVDPDGHASLDTHIGVSLAAWQMLMPLLGDLNDAQKKEFLNGLVAGSIAPDIEHVQGNYEGLPLYDMYVAKKVSNNVILAVEKQTRYKFWMKVGEAVCDEISLWKVIGIGGLISSIPKVQEKRRELKDRWDSNSLAKPIIDVLAGFFPGITEDRLYQSHFGRNQWQHGMAEKGTTAQDVQNKLVEGTANLIEKFQHSLQEGQYSAAGYYIGRASHYLQDTWTPSHTVRDEKSGVIKLFQNYNLQHVGKHAKADDIPPGSPAYGDIVNYTIRLALLGLDIQSKRNFLIMNLKNRFFSINSKTEAGDIHKTFRKPTKDYFQILFGDWF